MAKIKLEDIVLELEKEQWKVLSDKYENLDSEMIFCCPEGHKVTTTWKKLRSKKECPICKANVYKEQDTKIIPKPRGAKRVLGLDQATYISGFSVYDNGKLTRYGTFETSRESAIERDSEIRNWLINLINSWKPDYIGIEGIQFQDNKGGEKIGITTFEALARLQGILMITCYELGVPFEICPTNTWRAHCKVRGNSRTDKKRSMQLLAKTWYDVTVSEDEADAIGIGKYVAEVCARKNDLQNWEQ